MDKLLAGKPFIAGKVSLVAVEHLHLHSDKGADGFWITAQKELHAIIICDINGIRAVDLESKKISLEELVQALPELHAILTSLR